MDTNDGILAVDKNSNGTIDNGNEIFGNHTDFVGGGTATDGYAALAEYDSNSDGKVDLNQRLKLFPTPHSQRVMGP